MVTHSVPISVTYVAIVGGLFKVYRRTKCSVENATANFNPSAVVAKPLRVSIVHTPEASRMLT